MTISETCLVRFLILGTWIDGPFVDAWKQSFQIYLRTKDKQMLLVQNLVNDISPSVLQMQCVAGRRLLL